ncbi:hypothetical protein [Culturomica massiliensis]|uniref:hypothetical protein n=1 Tax=Culturomica massiliensis TaxID=1841857 RepID=UPI000A6384D9|nr:hypothetical protein [Culturomica massiliensis]
MTATVMLMWGSLVYRFTGGSSFVFESGLFGEGVVSGSSICYHLKDHLGSIRAIIDGSGRLLEENDYYAFGQRHPRSEHAQSSANRFKYNGKELQTVGAWGIWTTVPVYTTSPWGGGLRRPPCLKSITI